MHQNFCFSKSNWFESGDGWTGRDIIHFSLFKHGTAPLLHVEEVLLLKKTTLEQLMFFGKGEQLLNLRNDTWNRNICCLKQLLLLMEAARKAPPLGRFSAWNSSCYGEGYLKQLLLLGIVWIPIYNYSYRKFIYVSILKPRR
jgi:hypothetical protein